MEFKLIRTPGVRVMVSRLLILATVAGLGVTLPSEPEVRQFFSIVQHWAATRLAFFDTWTPEHSTEVINPLRRVPVRELVSSSTTKKSTPAAGTTQAQSKPTVMPRVRTILLLGSEMRKKLAAGDGRATLPRSLVTTGLIARTVLEPRESVAVREAFANPFTPIASVRAATATPPATTPVLGMEPAVTASVRAATAMPDATTPVLGMEPAATASVRAATAMPAATTPAATTPVPGMEPAVTASVRAVTPMPAATTPVLGMGLGMEPEGAWVAPAASGGVEIAVLSEQLALLELHTVPVLAEEAPVAADETVAHAILCEHGDAWEFRTIEPQTETVSTSPAFEPMDLHGGDALDIASVLNRQNDGLADPAVPARAQAAAPARTWTPMEIVDEPGIADELNAFADGIANARDTATAAAPNPAAPAAAATAPLATATADRLPEPGRVTQALTLTRAAWRAWMNVLVPPAELKVTTR